MRFVFNVVCFQRKSEIMNQPYSISGLFFVFQIFSYVYATDHTSIQNVVIIGAGTSGLVAAKHCIDNGLNVTVYEQNEELGGVWYYTDEVGKNKYGFNIHSSMYKGLRF